VTDSCSLSRLKLTPRMYVVKNSWTRCDLVKESAQKHALTKMRDSRRYQFVACVFLQLIFISAAIAKADRPNILWIVSEDNSPLLGAYGDTYATTPNIDELAKQSIVYDNAFANSPVCAPTRFSILTGMHASAMGTSNMRSRNKVPAFVKPYTFYLRAAGYHVTNDNKTDYNYATADIPNGEQLTYKEWQAIDGKFWDEGTYTDRKPGQPFVHIYNLSESHESRLHSSSHNSSHSSSHNRRHFPEDVILPPYHPDTPEIREDWALYYDRISQMDTQVGKKLAELQAAGLLDHTIVFYYSDHGGAVARSKRFLYDTGTKIPFMVRAPERFKDLLNQDMGSRAEQIVNMVDLAPTLLYFAGIDKPAHIHGNSIFGSSIEDVKRYAYLYRGRMDERIDLVRALRDKRFKYIRNYMPHRPNGQHLAYLWKAESVRSWEQACQQNQCNETQQRFWQSRQPEELYDTEADPWEVNNLVSDPAYASVLRSMRENLRRENRRYKDVGFIPEGELSLRTRNITGYDLVRQKYFPIDLVIETAEIASSAKEANLQLLIERLSHKEAVVRYWAAVGCRILQDKALPAKHILLKRLKDNSADVQIAAAEALAYLGYEKRALRAIMRNLKHSSPMVRLHAANVLDALGSKAKPAAKKLRSMVIYMEKLKSKSPEENYLLSALSHTVSRL